MINKASKQKITLTNEHLRIIFYNLLCSINFMHTANIIHRDVRPENILIDPICRVKICDFGLARTEQSKYVNNDFIQDSE